MGNYKTVVPKGFLRLLEKQAGIRDSGVRIYFSAGNHDMCMNGYFEKEMNAPVLNLLEIFNINTKPFFIGHGDGLGPHDEGYKQLKKCFQTNFSSNYFVGYIPI